MGVSLGLSMPSLLYGPEKGVDWQDALTLQAKLGSLSAPSCCYSRPGLTSPVVTPATEQYLFHVRTTSSLFS